MSWEKHLKRKDLEKRIEEMKKKFRFEVPTDAELAEYQYLVEQWKAIQKAKLRNVAGVLPQVDTPSEDDDGPCKRKLQTLYDYFKNKPVNNAKVRLHNELDKVPEKICCALLKYLFKRKGPFVDAQGNHTKDDWAYMFSAGIVPSLGPLYFKIVNAEMQDLYRVEVRVDDEYRAKILIDKALEILL